MSPFTGYPILISIDVEPIIRPGIEGEFTDLPTASAGRKEELSERTLSDHAVGLEWCRLPVQAHGLELKLIVLNPCGGSLRAVFDHVGGLEGGAIDTLVHRSLRESVMRVGPMIVGIRVAFAAALGPRVLGEDGIVAGGGIGC